MNSQRVSNTSRRVQGFTEQLAPIPVLVTNRYAYPAGKPRDIPAERLQAQIGQEIFDLLYQTCQPAAILFHGAIAIRFAKKQFDLNLDPYLPLAEQTYLVPHGGGERLVLVFAYPHLSGVGVRKGFDVAGMNSELAQLARRIRQAVELG